MTSMRRPSAVGSSGLAVGVAGSGVERMVSLTVRT